MGVAGPGLKMVRPLEVAQLMYVLADMGEFTGGTGTRRPSFVWQEIKSCALLTASCNAIRIRTRIRISISLLAASGIHFLVAHLCQVLASVLKVCWFLASHFPFGSLAKMRIGRASIWKFLFFHRIIKHRLGHRDVCLSFINRPPHLPTA